MLGVLIHTFKSNIGIFHIITWFPGLVQGKTLSFLVDKKPWFPVPSGHQTWLEQLAHLKTIPDQTLHSVRGDLPAVVDHTGGYVCIPSGYVKIAIENGH